jgi:hypothetical protein
MKPRFLHVANGTSTTLTIEAAGIPGVRSIWADVLYAGPVPGGLSDADLLDVRLRFHDDPAVDPVNDMREWRAAIEHHESYDELILWFEHDLFDQLNLIHLLSWIRERGIFTKPISLICIGSFPGRPDFKGLGELTPGELASLLETRQRVTDAQFALAERAWHAFREPTPEALDTLRREDTSALPYLSAAVTRLLQEYPWTIDGLSRSERRLLELANGGGIALRKAFPQMHKDEQAYYITDSSLAEMAEELSRASPSLLTRDLPDPDGHPLQAIVTLTETGRSVLAGRLDRIEIRGFDRWIGGVHAQAGANEWRWDDARQRVTRM